MIGVAPHRIAAPAQRAHRLQGPGRHVEVEQHALGPALGEHPLRHIEGELGGRPELTPLEVGAAHRQGLEAFDGALHRRRHGAGIEHIGAEVGAVVDAGEHQIGPLLQQGKQGELDAVTGGATAGPGPHPIVEQLIGPLRPDGGVQGEAMAGGGAFLVGANHTHLVAAG